MPAAKRGHSKTPIGPFQNTVFDAGDPLGEVALRLGPDVEPEPAVGQLVEGHDLRLGVRLEGRRGDDVLRQDDLELEGVRLAHLFRHLPADQHLVGATTEVPEHSELVLDLRAARDEQERVLDLTEQPAEHLELLLEQETRVRGEQRATPTVDAWAR